MNKRQVSHERNGAAHGGMVVWQSYGQPRQREEAAAPFTAKAGSIILAVAGEPKNRPAQRNSLFGV